MPGLVHQRHPGSVHQWRDHQGRDHHGAEWAAHYSKVYNGDEVQREAIYNANIEYINQNNEDRTMGPWTPFMDMSREEFQAQYISGIQGEITKGDAYLGQLEYSGAELPDDVDWSDSAHGAVTDIKETCFQILIFLVGSLTGSLGTLLDSP